MAIQSAPIGASANAMLQASLASTNKPYAAGAVKFSDALFATLDAGKQGYFEVSDLQSAFQQLGSRAKGLQADEVFSQLDGDSNGRITQDELATSLQKIAEQLQAQFNALRMGGTEGTPAARGGRDGGLTKDELSALAEASQAGTEASSNPRADLLSSLITNFDQADRNGDGRISAGEARAYQASNEGALALCADNTRGRSGGNGASEAMVMRQVMELMRTYANPAETAANPLTSGFSVAA
jgi:Ca2+-binding EF-hand superfamily protein